MAGRIRKRKTLSYAKWGYIFILPFFIAYAIFQLYPLITTFIYSFQSVQKVGTSIINRGWNSFENYKYLFATNDWLKYFGNTMLIQFMGFIPQLIVSLVLAVWFTDSRLKIKGASFFKAVIYMPNLIMATAMAQLFAAMFEKSGPLGQLFFHGGKSAFDTVWPMRWIVAFINFTMWFGNTTILLMAGVMGIDDSIFEAATIDGAGPIRTFKDITMPLLMPIFIYVFLTSLIGGIQMFDIPANVIPNDRNSGGGLHQIKTIIMYLQDFLGQSKNYGRAGALSVLLFLVTAVLSFVIYKTTTTDMSASKAKKKAKKAKKVNA